MHTRPQVHDHGRLDDGREHGWPMVRVISDTIQEFDGKRYYLCGFYFQRDGVRLHRVVWSAANGREIPDGFHVHHKDHDRSNNHPDNLELVEGSDHLSMHGLGHGRAPSQQAFDAAAKWHRSESGKQWHFEHYRKYGHTMYKRADMECTVCGKTFNGCAYSSKFCSNACKTKGRVLSGVDNEDRDCVECGTTFVVNKYSKTKTCGKACGAKASLRSRRARRGQ